jgi:hypothetical protein
MDSFLYKPTPLEEAYSQYLIRTVFPQPSDAATLRISGRHAVPFLSQSGLPRDVLRNLWFCVDPHTTGYLSDAQQFHTLLRLVALAQCQMIDASSNLQQCCFETAHRTDLPLATFHGYSIPDALTLMSSYHTTTVLPPPIPSAAALPTDPFQNLNGGQEMAQTHPSLLYPQHPSLMATSTSTGLLKEDADEEVFGDFTTTPATVTVGAWDALDQLVTVEDAPLPSLPTGLVKRIEENDFGTFAAAAPATIESIPTTGDDDDFGTFAGTNVVGAAHNFGNMEGSSTDGKVSADCYASSMESVTASIDLFDPIQSTPQQVMTSTYAAIHPVSNDLGLPSPVGDDVFSSAFVTNDGSATEHPLSPTADTTDTVPTNTFDDPFSAFDAISSVADSALPELTPEGASLQLNSTAIAPVVVTEETEGFVGFSTANGSSFQPISESLEPTTAEEMDYFGDFIGMTEKNAAVVAVNVDPNTETPHLERFDVVSMASTEATACPFPVTPVIENDWTALDALVGTKDAPLPSRQPVELSSTEGTATFNLAVKPEGSESEGFGDFVGISEIKENVGDTESPFPAPLECVANAEVLPPTTDLLQNGWNALDVFVGNDKAPINSLPSTNAPTPLTGHSNWSTDKPETSQALASKCDDRNSSVLVSTFPEEPRNGHASVEASSQESGWEALDALNLVPDAPLSIAMESRATSAPEMLNNVLTDAAHEDFSDGFGDFVSGPSAESMVDISDPSDFVFNVVALGLDRTQENTHEIPKAEISGWDAFDALHQGSDAALPSLFDVSKGDLVDLPDILKTANEDLSDGFGDFVSGPCTEIVMDLPAPVDVVSAANDDSFPVKRAVQPIIVTTSIQFDHADSSYYSATAKSVSSESQDFTNFEDAVMNCIDNENDADSSVPADSKNFDISTPVDSNDVKANDIQGLLSLTTENEDIVPFDSVSLVNPSITEPIVESTTNETIVNVQGNEFDFGDYTGFRNEDMTPSKYETALDLDDENNDFGDFEAVNGALDDTLSNAPQIVTESDDADFGDFGDFATAGMDLVEQPPNLVGHRQLVKGWNIESEEDLNWAKSQIVSKSSQLPDVLRLRANGSSVDFGACFDANIEMRIPLSDLQMIRILRCLQLMDLLLSSHSEIASTHWTSICSIVESKVSSGLDLLHDASKLPLEEKNHINAPLQLYVRGLGEMVRVVRCITATLADILLLPPSTTLSKDNVESCWHSSALALQAIQIESLWDHIQEHGVSLCLLQILPLESVVKIRSRSVLVETDLCHFSLQPFPDLFIDEVPTQVPVICGDQPYMACAANLLAHESDFFLKNFKK